MVNFLTPNLLQIPILEMQKSSLWLDIYNVICDITNLLKRKELKGKPTIKFQETMKFQETDSFTEDYRDLKQLVLKN